MGITYITTCTPTVQTDVLCQSNISLYHHMDKHTSHKLQPAHLQSRQMFCVSPTYSYITTWTNIHHIYYNLHTNSPDRCFVSVQHIVISPHGQTYITYITTCTPTV